MKSPHSWQKGGPCSLKSGPEQEMDSCNVRPLCSLWDLLGLYKGFPGGSDDKESACNAGDLGSIPGSGRSPGEGNGYWLQYSCLENCMDRGACQATVHEVTKSRTWLSDKYFHGSLLAGLEPELQSPEPRVTVLSASTYCNACLASYRCMHYLRVSSYSSWEQW